MPSIEENKRLFGQDYDWSLGGEEWSVAWGGPDMQWFGTLLPRLHRFLPAVRIVEIAPGYGRWTHYLKDHCKELIGIDVAEVCVAACKRRFAADPNLRFHVGDGAALPMVDDASVDLLFSFDSLVHADPDALGSYLAEAARVLRTDGVAWIHHSNLGIYAGRMDEVDAQHGRDPVTTDEKVRRFAEAQGLRCLGQELINWGTERALIDAISLFCQADGAWEGAGEVLENPDFMDEVRYLRRLAALYRPDRLEAGV